MLVHSTPFRNNFARNVPETENPMSLSFISPVGWVFTNCFFLLFLKFAQTHQHQLNFEVHAFR